MASDGRVGRGCGRTFTLAYGVATDGRAASVKRRSQPGPNSWTGALTPMCARPRAQRDRPYTRCTSRATTSTVPCASAHRAPMRKLIGPTKPRQGALGPGAEPEHHAPEHRAGIDFAPAPHRPAFTSQTLDLRLRQQAGQRLANTNKLDSGHGHSPDRLKLRNSNLIRGRGPLQPLVSWSITSLSEHQCRGA